MKNIPLCTAIGLVAISLAARAEDLSTRPPLASSHVHDVGALRRVEDCNALSPAPATITEHASVVDGRRTRRTNMSHGRVRRLFRRGNVTQHLRNNLAIDICQAEITPAVPVSQLLVIQPQQVQNGLYASS